MSHSSNLPLASQQKPWPLPPHRSATLDDTADDDIMIQSQRMTSISKKLQPPAAAVESETSAIPTSAVSDLVGEEPQWQTIMVAEQARIGQSNSPKSKKRSSSASLSPPRTPSPPARARAGEEDAEPVTSGTATSVGTTSLPSGNHIGS